MPAVKKNTKQSSVTGAGLPPVLLLLRAAWLLYRKNFWTIAGYVSWMLLPLILLTALDYLPVGENFVFYGTLLVLLANGLLWLWVVILLMRLSQTLVRNKKINPAKLQKGAHTLIFPLFLVSVLQSLLIFGGLILLIVPGIIFLIWYMFADLAVVLDNQTPLSGMSYSRNLSHGRFWRLLVILAAGLGALTAAYSLFLWGVYATTALVLNLPVDLLTLFDNPEQVPGWFDILGSLGDMFVFTPLLTLYLVMVYEIAKTTKLE